MTSNEITEFEQRNHIRKGGGHDQGLPEATSEIDLLVSGSRQLLELIVQDRQFIAELTKDLGVTRSNLTRCSTNLRDEKRVHADAVHEVERLRSLLDKAKELLRSVDWAGAPSQELRDLKSILND
jgi:hypothetical protein